MGRIVTLIVGILVMGAGYAVTFLEAMLPDGLQEVPIPYDLLIEYTSLGLYGLGAALAGYAILALLWGLAKANWKMRKEKKQQEQEQQQDGQQQPMQGGQQGQQQQGQYGQGQQRTGGQNQTQNQGQRQRRQQDTHRQR